MHLSHNKTYFQGQRTIEFLNLAFFSKNALFRSYGVLQLFNFLSLGTLCLCVSVTTFSPTTLLSGAWRRFQICKDTSFESYDAFSL